MNAVERRALLALWSIQGVGPMTLRRLVDHFGALAQLFTTPVREWARQVAWPGKATLDRVLEVETLSERAAMVEQQLKDQEAQAIFPGDAGWPERLDGVAEAPPLLFTQGPCNAAPRRKRLAIVGSRSVESGALTRFRHLARLLAEAGVGVVSGGAVGCDQAAHFGALDANGETWCVLGNALDQVDAPQQRLVAALRGAKQTVISQFPPGCRANLSTFIQRNLVISGVADAVLVLRAGRESGALHTAGYAKHQRRRLLVTPSDPWNSSALGSNALLRDGAVPVLDVDDVLRALELRGGLSPREVPAFELATVSPGAQAVYGALHAQTDFDELVARLPALSAGAVAAALVELELRGGVRHAGARRYEKR